MSENQKIANKFVVDFGDIELPAEVSLELNKRIRRAALSYLAELDLFERQVIDFQRPSEGIVDGLTVILAKNAGR